jgi:threonine aldolase
MMHFSGKNAILNMECHSSFIEESTTMIRFENDYAEGCHEALLKKLIETNDEQTPGYGTDAHCAAARALIRRECGAEDADVHFLVGGTQTNTVMIASVLRPHQGAVTAATGHIAMHETGAIEATGHKVLTLAGDDGKITAAQVRALHDEHYGDASREHAVQPGLVYISLPTENGTVYTKQELAALARACRECGVPLVVDGARLGYGLVAEGCDLALADVAECADMFSIGGTKVGALFGEAVVITNGALKKDFRYAMKQRGGMLAKGRLLGVQFGALFTDGLYWDISRRAVGLAMRIRRAFAEKGVPFRYNSPTNQQFPILKTAALEALGRKYAFSFWEKIDDNSAAVRVCTSWATREDSVNALVADIDRFC